MNKLLPGKILIVLVAIMVALGIWVALMMLFRHSKIFFLEHVSVWISHFSVFGWLLFGVLVFVISKLFLKVVFNT